jgi:hypothetical protein
VHRHEVLDAQLVEVVFHFQFPLVGHSHGEPFGRCCREGVAQGFGWAQ